MTRTSTYTGPKRNARAFANPWCDLDWERARSLPPIERAYERKAICDYYNQTDDPRPCECASGALRHKRQTVGAFQCPRCRTIETYAGQVIPEVPVLSAPVLACRMCAQEVCDHTRF